MNTRSHWDTVYATKAPDAVSWYRPHLESSLALIDRTGCGPEAALIDVGGGESTLVDDLLARRFGNVTVLDISPVALAVTRRRLGADAERVQWIEADVTRPLGSTGVYDVWHDRAVFHFLTAPEDRTAYVQNVAGAVKPGGHVIVGAFGPEGPTKCSGLPVVRYNGETLHHEFGRRFHLLESSRELHQTPAGATQQFLYCFCRLE